MAIPNSRTFRVLFSATLGILACDAWIFWPVSQVEMQTQCDVCHYVAELCESDPSRQNVAAQSLLETHHELVEAVIDSLQRKEYSVRTRAIWPLVYCARTDSELANCLTPILLEQLEIDPEEVPRGMSAYWLAIVAGRTEPDFVVPNLIEALSDESQYVQCKAMDGLAQIGPRAKSAIPVLIAQLSNADIVNRATAAYTLGRIGPDALAAVPRLVSALDDRMYVAERAAEALCRIDPETASRYGLRILDDVESGNERQ